jgi:hypothetical protein
MSNIVHMPRSAAITLSETERVILEDIAACVHHSGYAFPYQRALRPTIWALYDRSLITMVIREDEAPAMAFVLSPLGRHALGKR